MSRFRDELRVIPGAAKVTAWILSLSALTLLEYVLNFVPDNKSSMPPVGRVLLPLVAFVVVFVYIQLIGYVYGDAKRRGMRQVMWTLLSIFIPNAIGIIVYFILRDPLPITCASCGASVLSKFTFCPRCGSSVKPVCPHCGKAVEMGWTHCANCGTTLPTQPVRAV